ncbi:MAG TPA: type II secretion system protein GspG [Thermoanaerobaculia bacterium]|nr:type II secretion system protein GspG [Thermoanaerobaculia bacterium]
MNRIAFRSVVFLLVASSAVWPQPAAASAGHKHAAAKASNTKKTMDDMHALSLAVETYAIDHEKYPVVKDMKALARILQPDYMKVVPLKDAWGTSFEFLVSPDLKNYRFVSAGPNRAIDPTNLIVESKPSGKNDDIIFEEGFFVQEPTGKTEKPQ